MQYLNVLVTVLVTIIIVGVVWYLFDEFVALQGTIKWVVYALAGIIVFLYVLCELGIYCFHGG